MKENSSSLSVKNETDRHLLFEQYKILIEYINKTHDIREISNNFWIGVNGFGVSIIAYFRNTSSIPPHHKAFFLGTLVVVGVIYCLIWLSYLKTIKKSVEASNDILLDMEKKFPVRIFSDIFSRSGEKASKPTLTLKEMLVPSLFMGGYIFFAILLIFFPKEVMSGN